MPETISLVALIATPGRTGAHRGPGERPAKIKIVAASLWPKCVIYKYSSSVSAAPWWRDSNTRYCIARTDTRIAEIH